eukprot:TRINITY_DN1507_c0_g1_i1.p1 TRINITY_DN1507_c0_g1~~TRINITY_DN1507_c0_g1_i1.p1  ORF type:complete len:1050 (+),score=164.29 TRINITY_DN1507_c0_g1_i1:432-3152(+)
MSKQGISQQDQERLRRLGFPTRPEDGQEGREIKVVTNMFLLRTDLQECYHHDVAIYDETMFKAVEEAVAQGQGPIPESNLALPGRSAVEIVQKLAANQDWNNGWAYDGRKNIFAVYTLLKNPPEQFSTMEIFDVAMSDSDGNRTRNFKVKITYTNKINLQVLREYLQNSQVGFPRVAIQALEVAFNHKSVIDPMCIRVGRGIFYPPRSNNDFGSLGFGLSMWYGYKQSVAVCRTGLAINIDQAGSIFVDEQPVMAYMDQVLGFDRGRPDYLNDRQLKDLRIALKDIKIQMTHRYYEGNGHRVYPTGVIQSLGPPPTEATFDWNGRQVTVADYFAQQYNIQVKDSVHLPCLKVGKGLLPMEFAHVVNQQRRSNVVERAKGMIPRLMARPPSEKLDRIMAKVNTAVRDTVQRGNLESHWRVQMKPSPITAKARILPNPILKYGGGDNEATCVDVGTDGAWNLKDIKFFRPAEIKSWAIASFSYDRDVNFPDGVPRLIEVLMEQMSNCGMKIPNIPPPVFYLPQNVQIPYDRMQMFETAKRLCREAGKAAYNLYKSNPEILLVLLPTTSADLYNAVKRATVAASGIGVPSQCFVAEKAGIGGRKGGRSRGVSPDYCANLAMKINVKMGGTVVSLAGGAQVFPIIGQAPFMVLGIDISHPAPGNRSQKSLAAVVGSIDMYAQRYLSEMRPQGHRVQMVQELESMVKQLCLSFYQSNKRKPERFLIFRDGVSDGQQRQVLEDEYIQIRKAFQSLEAEYAPPVTYVVVNKTHSVRLFPTDDSQDTVGKSRNVMPGTVVDGDITHPHHFDYYLVSHQGIQGTSRPIHYTVILDENRFGADAMQLMTYWMTYTFCRCTRSVSVVPPVYYANEVCKKGVGIQLREEMVTDSDSAVSGEEEAEVIHQTLARRMWYV